VGNELKAARDRGEQPEPDPDQRLLMKFYGGYWIVILLCVMGLVAIASPIRHRRQTRRLPPKSPSLPTRKYSGKSQIRFTCCLTSARHEH
jgi:hypothetical protein